MTINYVSLFSGIEAFSVAASRIKDVNWNPVFFSEIDPFASAVLQHHFPGVPNLGDVTQIKIDTETNTASNHDTTITLPRNGIDILAGGSPCQDVSVAGRRAGMSEGSGTRSSLAFEYARLVEELRPRVILWENVPGVLSSNNGRDFLAFQRSLVKRGYSLAYRVLDAQYTRVDSAPRAVPQRRKRVWLVGCLGGAGQIPAQILFERPCLLGDTAPRREAGQGFAAPALYGPARHDRSGSGATGTVAAPLCAADGKGKNGMDIIGKCAVVPAAFCESGQGWWSEGTTPLRVGGERPSSPTNVVVTSASFDGADCSPTLRASNGTPGQSNQEIFSQGGAYLARVATYENHAQDSRVKEIDVSDTRSQEVVVGFNTCTSPRFPDGGAKPESAGTLAVDHREGVALCVDAYNQSATAESCMTLRSAMSGADRNDADPKICIGFMPSPSAAAGGIGAQREVAPCINAAEVKCVAIGVDQQGGKSAASSVAEASPTMASDSHGTPHAVALAFAQNQREEVRDLADAATALAAEPGTHQQTYAAIGVFNMGGNKASAGTDCSGATPSLLSQHGTDPHAVAIRTANTGANGHGVANEATHTLDCANGQAVARRAIVRRLTPGECESLQFFPQGWTRIPYRGKPASECPDSPRYKALGNSWATNCAEWILRRIVAAFRLGIIDQASGPTAG